MRKEGDRAHVRVLEHTHAHRSTLQSWYPDVLGLVSAARGPGRQQPHTGGCERLPPMGLELPRPAPVSAGAVFA